MRNFKTRQQGGGALRGGSMLKSLARASIVRVRGWPRAGSGTNAKAANGDHESALCTARITSPTRQQGGGALRGGSLLKSLARAFRNCAIRA